MMILPADLVELMNYLGVSSELAAASTPFMKNIKCWLLSDRFAALQEATGFSESEPGNILAHLSCCYYHCKRRDVPQALKAYERIDLAQDNAAKHLCKRANFRLHFLEDPWGAIEDFDYALVIDPLHEVALHGRNQARLASKAVRLRVDDKPAPELRETSVRGILAKADEKEAMKDYSGALEHLDLIRQLYPRCHRGFYFRAAIKELRLDDPVGAADELTKAIAVAPGKDMLHSSRARVRYKARDFAGALADINEAIALEPYNHNYYFFRGDIRSELDDFEGGTEDKEMYHMLIRGYLPPGFKVPN